MQKNNDQDVDETSAGSDSVRIEPWAVAITLAKRKGLILALPVIGGLVALIIVLLLPKLYTATGRILPPQQTSSSAAAMLGQLGSLAGGAANALGIKSPAELYIGMLKSRTVADALIARFDLRAYYKADLASTARKHLADSSKISAGKDGIITIEVDDRDPKRAADIANGYIEELTKLTTVLAVTEAAQRRLFFEQQLEQAKNNLLKAELAARDGLDSGVTVIDARGKSLVETSAQLRARAAAKEVELKAMRAFATERHPDIDRVKGELAALRDEIGKLEGATPARLPSGSNSNPRGIKNLELLRNVRYFEFLFELLGRQYEVARIDEAKDTAIIQVLDRAIEPDQYSKPRRLLIVTVSSVVTMIVALVLAMLLEHISRIKSDPIRGDKLKQFLDYLRQWR
ncbi:MAG: Wzz/FepE/Etk N-terminal domain-containing protein [Rhodospirillaceae bacterium]